MAELGKMSGPNGCYQHSPALTTTRPWLEGPVMATADSTAVHRCSKCGETKPVQDFPLRKNRGNTPSSWCRACTNRQRQQTHPLRHPPSTDNSVFEFHFISDEAKAAGREYRDIAGFVGYRVGNDGTVWSCLRRVARGQPRQPGPVWFRLSPDPGTDGHLRVPLFRDGKAVRRLVHHLVLEAFVGPCPEGMEGCHFPDWNPANNHLSNLRWDTRQGNWRDRKLHGHARRRSEGPR
jgi:hypothetical protein